MVDRRTGTQPFLGETRPSQVPPAGNAPNNGDPRLAPAPLPRTPTMPRAPGPITGQITGSQSHLSTNPNQTVPMQPVNIPQSSPNPPMHPAYGPPGAVGGNEVSGIGPAPGTAPMPGVHPHLVQFPRVGSALTSQRGAYVVRNIIGSGEFGAVYEAIGPFDQVYAVKMMRPANRPYVEVQAEWAKEVTRLVTLRHPNIVYIHDAFEENHLFYLALERCDHPLLAMLGQPMQEGLVIELGRQILAAVQFLHDQDVVHDDLHPGNVLITHTDRPVVKISDFGISNELRGMGVVRPNVVHHAIMAPELLVTGYTSRQSDLYQVGLLFYWMLTGTSAIPKDAAYQELVQMVSDGEPRRRAELIGTPLGALVAKMLRRRETYRYTSAREVWAELREIPAWKTRELFPPK